MTYNTSIQVYTAADSLLVRRIPITLIEAGAPKGAKPATIVSTKQSRQDPNLLWVTCSDGVIYQIDWTTNTKHHKKFQTVSKTAKALVTFAHGKSEVLVVAESDKPTRLELVAYQWNGKEEPSSKSLVTFKKPGNGLQLLEISLNGQILLGALNDRVFLGKLALDGGNGLDALQHEFFSFDAPDLITTVDLRTYKRSTLGKKAKADTSDVVDILVGGARGGIYLYHDAVARCQAEGGNASNKESLHAQKFHWHRKAVHAVKWSRDGKFTNRSPADCHSSNR